MKHLSFYMYSLSYFSFTMGGAICAGDVTGAVSVVCSTSSQTATGSSLRGLESGSDFVSRGTSNAYRVIFPAGIHKAACVVKVNHWTLFLFFFFCFAISGKKNSVE
jgi:hypothetical protein